jgi:4-alpha-glucanotransferase
VTPLQKLAQAAGIALRWTDAQGQPQRTPPENLRHVLRALDYPAETPAQIRDSQARLGETLSRPLLPVVGQGAAFPSRGRILRLTGEDGRRHDLPVKDGMAQAHIPPGYYRMENGQRLAVTPARAFELSKPAWGVSVQLYSLRGSRGIGDFAALTRLAAQAARAGGDAILLSPLHALPRGGISPYSPTSRQFLNPLYLPARGEDDGEKTIDWRAVEKQRLRGLHKEFARFDADPAFDRFVKQGGARLKAHARFMAEKPDDVRFQFYLQWRADAALARVQAAARADGMAIGLMTDIAVGVDPNGSDAHVMPQEMLRGLTIGAPPDVLAQAGQNWGLTSFSPSGLIASGYEGFLQTLRAAMRHAGGIRLDHAMSLMRLWVIPEGGTARDGAYLHYPFDALLGLLCLESQRHRALVIAEDMGTVTPAFRRRLEQAGLLGMDVLWFVQNRAGFVPPGRWSAHRAALTTTHDLPTMAGWWTGRDLDWRERLGGKNPGARRKRENDRRALWRALRKSGAPAAFPANAAPFIDGALAALATAPSPLKLVALEDFIGEREQPNIPGTIDEHPNWRRRLSATDPLGTPAARRRARLLSQEQA